MRVQYNIREQTILGQPSRECRVLERWSWLLDADHRLKGIRVKLWCLDVLRGVPSHEEERDIKAPSSNIQRKREPTR